MMQNTQSFIMHKKCEHPNLKEILIFLELLNFIFFATRYFNTKLEYLTRLWLKIG